MSVGRELVASSARPSPAVRPQSDELIRGGWGYVVRSYYRDRDASERCVGQQSCC
jgi:hypothetical protein